MKLIFKKVTVVVFAVVASLSIVACGSDGVDNQAVSNSPTPKSKPLQYKAVTDREWSKIQRSPQEHIGEAYEVYIDIFEFNQNTGPRQFLGDCTGEDPGDAFTSWQTCLAVASREKMFDEIVQGDLVKAKVTIAPFEYLSGGRGYFKVFVHGIEYLR